MGSAFTSLRLEESRPSSLGARPEVEVEVEVEVQREDKTGQGQELDRTRESRVVAGPPGNVTVEPAKVWFGLLAVVYVSLYFSCFCLFLSG